MGPPSEVPAGAIQAGAVIVAVYLYMGCVWLQQVSLIAAPYHPSKLNLAGLRCR